MAIELFKNYGPKASINHLFKPSHTKPNTDEQSPKPLPFPHFINPKEKRSLGGRPHAAPRPAAPSPAAEITFRRRAREAAGRAAPTPPLSRVWIPPGGSYWALRSALGSKQASVTGSGLRWGHPGGPGPLGQPRTEVPQRRCCPGVTGCEAQDLPLAGDLVQRSCLSVFVDAFHQSTPKKPKELRCPPREPTFCFQFRKPTVRYQPEAGPRHPLARWPAGPPARRPSPPGGTYTAQGRRVPPSAAGSQLQIKLPAVGGGPRGQRTKARRRFPRGARVSAATRPRALPRRPPGLCRAPAAAAHSELRGEEPGVADASQTQPATRSPARAELSSPPPASLPPSLRSSVVAAVADKCDVGRRGLPLSQAASASASPALARSRGRRLHLSAGRPGVRRGAGAPRAAHSAHSAHSARTRPAAARTRTRGAPRPLGREAAARPRPVCTKAHSIFVFIQSPECYTEPCKYDQRKVCPCMSMSLNSPPAAQAPAIEN
ncbi:translation initiation factor IF-2-like [Peromyscus californicus insignis]|uniref:translation initiation factor IF-2-like n=1 Tax=Peromyscus californicus insignis TaxID=564181 RepID=UPI0022A6685E|nr:translation initiation factor IF-2-like [Peromyscus californicus insignis]